MHSLQFFLKFRIILLLLLMFHFKTLTSEIPTLNGYLKRLTEKAINASTIPLLNNGLETGFQPDANRVCRTISVRQTLPFCHTLSFYLYIHPYNSPCASISSSHIVLISSIFSSAAVCGSSMAAPLLFHNPFSTSIGSLPFNQSILSQIFYYFLDLFSCKVEFFHKLNLCYRRLFFHSL